MSHLFYSKAKGRILTEEEAEVWVCAKLLGLARKLDGKCGKPAENTLVKNVKTQPTS